MARQIKCFVLLSGGLDSMLAVKVLQAQGIQVTGLTFQSYFFGPDSAQAAANQLKIPLKIIDFSGEHLQIVKNPPHGRGKAANPCIDCHLLMLRQAQKIMAKDGYQFVATGEVLGERPFSQSKVALLKIADQSGLGERPFSQSKTALLEIATQSGLGERLLRPLSAALLPKTQPEKRGWVDVQKLPAIEGRSRQIQLALAKQYGLKQFPQPAGGCLLTDKVFGQKLLTMLAKWPSESGGNNVQLVKLSRHFWDGEVLIVLGRNQLENERLAALVKEDDFLLVPQNFPGPSALLRGHQITPAVIAKAKQLILQYTKKKPAVAQFTAVPANYSPVPGTSAQA